MKLLWFLLCFFFLPIQWFIGLTVSWFILIVFIFMSFLLTYFFMACFLFVCYSCFLLVFSDVLVGLLLLVMLQWCRILQISVVRSESFAFRKGNEWDGLIGELRKQKVTEANGAVSASKMKLSTTTTHTHTR